MLKKLRITMMALAGWSMGLVCTSFGGTFTEDFSAPPERSGWRLFGETNLFVWNQASAQLQVTWDSAHPNSYFYRPLGTILAKDDDFTLQFDLRLIDIGTGAKSGPFQIAIGLLNLADACRDGYWRWSGVNETHGPRNLVEFDYFPAGYYPAWQLAVDPTISPTIVSANNTGFATGFTLLELANEELFHVTLAYTASDRTLRTSLTRGGAPFEHVDDVPLGTSFTDFRLDTLAIASYSDAGDDYDSVLAHGIVDNISLTIPPPPIAAISGQFKAGAWQVQFQSRSNWLYSLERTQDLISWTTVTGPVTGDGGPLVIADPSTPPATASYRVSARKP